MASASYEDKRMELTEHLAELRQRILRSILYVLVGTILAYQFFKPIYGLLYRPLLQQMYRVNYRVSLNSSKKTPLLFTAPAPVVVSNPPTQQQVQQMQSEIVMLSREIAYLHTHPQQPGVLGNVFHGFYEMFTVRLKLSLLFGMIITIPLVVWEAAMFVLPALTPTEREPLRTLIPVSILLLICGVTIAYLTMYYAMGWFLSYLSDFPAGATLMQDPNDYILFFVKMMAAFGIAFQLPVVLMLMAYMNLINSRSMLKNWRWGVVIAVLGGVLTPSNDLISMALMAVPLLLLYFLSIGLIWGVERKRAASSSPESQ